MHFHPIRSLTVLLLALVACAQTACFFTPSEELMRRGSINQGGNGGNPNTSLSANQYFTQRVEPMFRARCITCHNEPRFGGNGPLTIYTYSQMVSDLIAGSAPDQNDLIFRVTAQTAHFGGNQCASGMNESPCKEIQQWFNLEISERGSTQNVLPQGAVVDVSVEGVVSGWAGDVNAAASALQVEIYADGPRGSGQFLGAVTANRTSNASTVPGNHGFVFTIPDSLRDRQPHPLYFYAQDSAGGPEKLLGNAPVSVRIYPLSTAGRNYYNNTVRVALQNRCNSCHNGTSWSTTYEAAFYGFLLSPTPANGGTAQNNLLRNKARGVNHGGNVQCANDTASPCDVVALWYAMEFP